MPVLSKVAVFCCSIVAFSVSAQPTLAATQGKQQNFLSIFTISKPAAPPAEKKQKDCGDFFTCLFGGSRGGFGGNATFGGHFREVIDFDDPNYRPGSIIIRTPERALYYVLPEGRAVRYRVGVGREGFQWSGNSHIIAKQEWPSWTPPARMIAREAAKGHYIPTYMDGGPNNPLGARALYIGGTIFRIHGTNDARSIGGAVSSGCIRMLNADVIELYEKVRVGAPVYVYQ